MPGEVIDRPNPPALPSHLPDFTEKLIINLERKPLPKETEDALKNWQRAANYIAAGDCDILRSPRLQLTSHSNDLSAR